MAKGSRILIQHLEGISGDVFASHPDILRDLIRGQSGIYALYSGNRLHYVGLASNLMRRVKQHLRDRHRGKWDRFSVYMTRRADHIKELESLLIRIVQPSGNRTGGRLAGSRNLSRELNGRMKESDKARRAKLLGGAVAARHRRRKSVSGSLSGIFDKRVPLKGERAGWEYHAMLRRDGTISYDGDVYKSPSLAASAATGHNTNGWRFWSFKKKGEWVPLGTLRGS